MDDLPSLPPLPRLPEANASDGLEMPTIPPEQLERFENLKYHLFLLKLQFVVLYFTTFVLSSGLLMYLVRTRRGALTGNASDARKAILPAFSPLLWIVLFISFAYSVFFVLVVAFNWFPQGLHSAEAEACSAGRNFIALLVMVFIHQKSVSKPALKRACWTVALVVCYPIPILYYMEHEQVDSETTRAFIYGARGLLAFFYIYVTCYPPARANVRVLRQYAGFSLVYICAIYFFSELFVFGYTEAGLIVMFAAVFWTSLYPIVIFRVLKADTEHWRGMGQRAFALQKLHPPRRRLDEQISSQGLHLLIEMHRKHVIDFAYLRFIKQIGKGATAVVFEGFFKSKYPVAVKVYTPVEINEEAVGNFSSEAALAGILEHPNIVSFYGMCVCPPNICLVFELCSNSLDAVLKENAKNCSSARQQFCINLSYMIDAARSVQYLHSFLPPFIHRDIKPSNFLVDKSGVVKMTDFGESRLLPHANHPSDNDTVHSEEDATHSIPLYQHQTSRKMTIRGTVDFLAPELIQGSAGQAQYNESVDIYSLAISFWRILYPDREMYPHCANHFKIYEAVLNGDRPEFDDTVNERLKSLIQNAWATDPADRPSANRIVQVLQDLQQSTAAVIATNLKKHMPMHSKKTWKASVYRNVFSGEEAVAHMLGAGYVINVAEATRLGNALMDCGYLHHAKHQRAFEQSTALYTFDDPRSAGASIKGRLACSSTHFSSGSNASGNYSECDCRRLAQGYDRSDNSLQDKRPFFNRKESHIPLITQTSSQYDSDSYYEL